MTARERKPIDQFASPDVALTQREHDVLLRSRVPLADHAATIGTWLRYWALATPDRTMLAERPNGDTGRPWRQESYSEALDVARSVGQALLDMGLGPERPLAVLSGPSLDHGRLALACHLAGVPIVPVSEAYSLRSTTLERVRYICDLTQAGAVFANSSESFERALAEVGVPHGRSVITSDGETGYPLRDLIATDASTIDDRSAQLDGSTVAKILFTSGSTGQPKGVLTTHGMLCSNQQAMAQVWPFLDYDPPQICDWLPWSHTFGGSHNFNMVLRNGGSMYLDGGRPSPDGIGTTMRNLAEVQPTIAFNVPAGWARLVEGLESDPDMAAKVLSRMRIAFYAGAALSADIWDRLAALVDRHAPGQVAMVSSWGMTETAPAVLAVHHRLDRPGVIGTPLPGSTVKLVPSGEKTEIRVAGPGIMPGYLHDPERSAAVFDDEGYLHTGDAGRLADPADPNAGVVFDGRIAEDFKLATGTWVSAGRLRLDVIAAASPLILDAVVTGHDRDWIGLLLWLTPAHSDSEEVRNRLIGLLAQFNATAQGSSRVVRRILIESELPSIEAGEITDKGYVNQQAVLRRRAARVASLYSSEPHDSVLKIVAP